MFDSVISITSEGCPYLYDVGSGAGVWDGHLDVHQQCARGCNKCVWQYLNVNHNLGINTCWKSRIIILQVLLGPIVVSWVSGN